MGGEHWSATSNSDVQAGSSPHGRGTSGLDRRRGSADRFIPAWAGNITAGSNVMRACSVHPRMGGEHEFPRKKCTCRNGSSPHGRGTSCARTAASAIVRFIPAWAGNMPRSTSAGLSTTVHPRMGGEHNVKNAAQAGSNGSSPHGRGTWVNCASARVCYRFIPAWAGNIRPRSAPSISTPVHPRMGGEHGFGASAFAGECGSSPHGRGTCLPVGAGQRAGRFIPAWAGNIPFRTPRPQAPAVHPRMGGEHFSAVSVTFSGTGSSPHGRGT